MRRFVKFVMETNTRKYTRYIDINEIYAIEIYQDRSETAYKIRYNSDSLIITEKEYNDLISMRINIEKENK